VSAITNRSSVACLRVKTMAAFFQSDGKIPLRSLEIEAIFVGRHINLRSKRRAVGAFNGCGCFGRLSALQKCELQTGAKDKHLEDR
jgi:hypothetical protein